MAAEESSTEYVLGGSRKASVVDDESCYPLNTDEFLLIDDVAKPERMTNAQAIMISIAISMGSAALVDIISTEYIRVLPNKSTEIILHNVLITSIYFSIFLGCTIGFILTRNSRNQNVSQYARLSTRIRTALKLKSE